MCLGIPMQITEINDTTARCSAKGIEREVSLFLLQESGVSVGDFVLVHVGYAIQRIDEQEARTTWALVDELLATEERNARA